MHQFGKFAPFITFAEIGNFGCCSTSEAVWEILADSSMQAAPRVESDLAIKAPRKASKLLPICRLSVCWRISSLLFLDILYLTAASLLPECLREWQLTLLFVDMTRTANFLAAGLLAHQQILMVGFLKCLARFWYLVFDVLHSQNHDRRPFVESIIIAAYRFCQTISRPYCTKAGANRLLTSALVLPENKSTSINLKNDEQDA